MPPYRREMPASLDASENVGHDSVMSVAGVFDSNFDEPALIVMLPPKVSLPLARARRLAPAAEKVECPDTYSGNGGVTTVSCWYGIHCCDGTFPKPWFGPSHEVMPPGVFL